MPSIAKASSNPPLPSNCRKSVRSSSSQFSCSLQPNSRRWTLCTPSFLNDFAPVNRMLPSNTTNTSHERLFFGHRRPVGIMGRRRPMARGCWICGIVLKTQSCSLFTLFQQLTLITRPRDENSFLAVGDRERDAAVGVILYRVLIGFPFAAEKHIFGDILQ